MMSCSVCGNDRFEDRAVIWDGLAAEWGLDAEERRYVDRQQGTSCVACGANLRSVALADAIRAWAGTTSTLAAFVQDSAAAGIRILEINEAGSLSPTLRRLPGHVLAAYPEVDMQALPYGDGAFDLVVHSDTLEHVPDPLQGLAECHRVLRPGGALCFTVPTLVGRLTRSRAGLPPSHHGAASVDAADFLVHSEFGADMWTWPVRAGFAAVSIHAVDYPSALAMTALRRDDGVTDVRGSPLEQRIGELEQLAATLQDELRRTQASASWRVTKPARAAAGIWRRLRSRF